MAMASYLRPHHIRRRKSDTKCRGYEKGHRNYARRKRRKRVTKPYSKYRSVWYPEDSPLGYGDLVTPTSGKYAGQICTVSNDFYRQRHKKRKHICFYYWITPPSGIEADEELYSLTQLKLLMSKF